MSKRGQYNGKGAKKAKPMQQQFYQKKQMLPEKKSVDTALTLSPVIATVNTNASAFPLNVAIEGSGVENRIGRKITCKSIRIRGTATCAVIPDGTTGQMKGNLLRMVLIWDKTPGGNGIPNFNTVFRRQDVNGTTANGYLDPVNVDQMQRFQVLRDVCIEMNPTTTGSGGTTNDWVGIFKFDEYVKLGRTTEFMANAGAAADIASGGLFLYFRADSAAAGNQISIENDSFARLRFVG